MHSGVHWRSIVARIDGIAQSVSTSSILMIDDDADLCGMVVTYLKDDGFDACSVQSGEAGLELMQSQSFDALILDVMMPGLNGHEVLRRLRSGTMAISPVPVLMLTARGDDVDKIVGLESGADDYLAKPCNLRELAARLRAILRRSSQTPVSGGTRSQPLAVGNIRLDASARQASQEGQSLSLTGAEFSILQILMEHAGSAVSKEVLMKSALGRDYLPYDRSVDVHVANLRKKLHPSNADGTPIKTIRGVGYQLIDTESGF
ncbi:MAG: response regulator transcription factor [Gammaproteobacteria bacterium]|nr:response regulator transcription factor [Gammaproteobacteria bacterium]